MPAAVRRRDLFLAFLALPRIRITRVRLYHSPISRPMINQSFHVVTVETDAGITGIGEGGSPDLIRQAAQLIIGEDARQTDALWQLMCRGLFYPPGREQLHAIGALDMALWDIRAKALNVPLYQILGGKSREYIECYSTAFPRKGTLAETARACIEAGFRAYRTSVADPGKGEPFDARAIVRKTVAQCREIREAVGPAGDWAIDYHTRLDYADAVRLSALLEPLEPLFAEDLVRSENKALYRQLRQAVRLPIAVGEQFGDRWEIHQLVEEHLIDWCRVSIPNCGGITEFLKICALCETHYVGMAPHFTGPAGEAALIHCLLGYSGPVLMEILGDGRRDLPYLPEHYDFRNGKLWPNARPGLGVTFDPSRLNRIAEVTEGAKPIPIFRRPDGSLTNW